MPSTAAIPSPPSPSSPLHLRRSPQRSHHALDLWQLAPLGPNGWALLGDVARYVSVSPRRFKRVAYAAAGGISALVAGAAGETVTLVALKPAAAAEAGTEWEVVAKEVRFETSAEQTVAFD